MDTIRGIALWLGPPLLASIGLTAVLHFATGGHLAQPGLRQAMALTAMSLVFTLPGSALLALIFAWTEERRVPLYGRYGLMIALGGVAGATLMMFSTAALLGCAYGAGTAVAWVGLHSLLYPRSSQQA
jgi:hypothetical protein